MKIEIKEVLKRHKLDLARENIEMREIINKQIKVLDKIKEYIKEDKNCIPKHISDYILELLEEIE